MFESQPPRMWRSHAAVTKNNDGRNYTCIRKTQTNQSCGVSRRHKFLIWACLLLIQELSFPHSLDYTHVSASQVLNISRDTNFKPSQGSPMLPTFLLWKLLVCRTNLWKPWSVNAATIPKPEADADLNVWPPILSWRPQSAVRNKTVRVLLVPMPVSGEPTSSDHGAAKSTQQ